MLTASMHEPTTPTIGDFWYCLYTRELLECVPGILASRWVAIPTRLFASALPHPILANSLLPSLPIWIDINDPDCIPYQYNALAGQWIPVVDLSFFILPPLNPSSGYIWINAYTFQSYYWTGTNWSYAAISSLSSVGVSSSVVPPAPPGAGAQAQSSGIQGSLHAGAAAAGGSGMIINGGVYSSINAQGVAAGGALGNISISYTPVAVPVVTFPSGGPVVMQIGNMVDILRDGSIAYNSSYTPDTAAKMFWEAMAHYLPPGVTTFDIEDLIKKVEYAKSKGIKFPEDQKKVDPIDAWNSAMGIVAP